MRARGYAALLPGLAGLLVAGCAQPARSPPGEAAPPPRAASIIKGPPFALTVDQLFAWTPEGPLADPRNRSAVPLAARFVDPDTRQDRAMRVLYAPDGIDGLGNYLSPQPVFNLYTFSHWAQIDLLNWFAGTADNSVNIPARPWVDAAHRNGVKVLGTVFFAPVAWGGSADTVERFLRQAPDGGFPAADRLVAIARHYGFDGWFINQETDLAERRAGERIVRDPARGAQAAAIARRMRDFTAYLTRISPAPMEVHWYDSMLTDGTVRWQNALTERNAPLLQDGQRRVADAIFLNYGWTAAGLERGAALAERLGRSRYDVFIGADLWPMRNSGQAAFRDSGWIRALQPDRGAPALGSLALFAPHFNFGFGGDERTARFSRFASDPADVGRFHDTETRLFAGDDLNMGVADGAGAWPGIGWLVPARSPITKLPFATSFNTGHGRIDAAAGVPVGGAWSDMSRQDILPSWQFSYPAGARVSARYDFDHVWSGGSSLRIDVADRNPEPVEIPLFLTDLPPAGETGLRLVSSATAASRFAVRLHFRDGGTADFALAGRPRWSSQSWCLPRRSSALVRISVLVNAAGSAAKAAGHAHVGQLALTAGCGAPR